MSKFTVKHVDNICNTEEMYFADKVVFWFIFKIRIAVDRSL